MNLQRIRPLFNHTEVAHRSSYRNLRGLHNTTRQFQMRLSVADPERLTDGVDMYYLSVTKLYGGEFPDSCSAYSYVLHDEFQVVGQYLKTEMWIPGSDTPVRRQFWSGACADELAERSSSVIIQTIRPLDPLIYDWLQASSDSLEPAERRLRATIRKLYPDAYVR